MSGSLASSWISGAFVPLSSSSSCSASSFDSSRISRFQNFPSRSSSASFGGVVCRCRFEANDLKFVLHDALESYGVDTTHARAAREGFFFQIKKLSDVERETSICISKGTDLGKTALYIAAEDDSLISHSSVSLPVDAYIERLDDLSMGYCSHYSSSFRSSPEIFIQCLERYLYVNKGFQRTKTSNQMEQRALYLHSVLTHRSGSASMLSLIYSEILKMLRLWGLLEFDIEIFFPHDSYSSPRGYQKQKSKESDQPHIMTSQLLLVEILRDLKDSFWPFQLDDSGSLFLRAARAANCFDRSNHVEESGFKLASAKAAQHRLGRGVWTSVRFGDMRRALSACERLIVLGADLNEYRDYGILLYHCGFYEESLRYLKLYQKTKASEESTDQKQSSDQICGLEEDAVEKLIIRLNLILMEKGWSRPSHAKNLLCSNSEPW